MLTTMKATTSIDHNSLTFSFEADKLIKLLIAVIISKMKLEPTRILTFSVLFGKRLLHVVITCADLNSINTYRSFSAGIEI